MTKTKLKPILQRHDIDFYQEFNNQDVSILIKDLESLLKNYKEIEIMKEDEIYSKNVGALVRFLYTKALSERTETTRTNEVSEKRKSLFSSTSLDTLYSLPI